MLKHIPFYASLMGANLYDKDTATTSHVLVYGAIEAHSMGDRGCIASNKTIASETGLKESTTAKCISQLNKAGWVSVELDENNHRKLIQPLLTITPPLPTSKPPFTPQKTPLYSTVNIDNSNKKTVIDNSTNVELAKAEASLATETYGNDDINKILALWESTIGYKITSNQKKNRFAINNLLKKYGYDGLKGILGVVKVMNGDKYAPSIADFCSIQSKQNEIQLWVSKKRATVESKVINLDGGLL